MGTHEQKFKRKTVNTQLKSFFYNDQYSCDIQFSLVCFYLKTKKLFSTKSFFYDSTIDLFFISDFSDHRFHPAIILSYFVIHRSPWLENF